MKIKEVTKLTGKSRTAILRAIQDGRLSAEKDASGSWEIDPAELVRVYDVIIPEQEEGVRRAHVRAHLNSAHRTGGGAQGDTPEIVIEHAVLQAELKSANQMLEDRARTIDDLRTRLDKSEQSRDEAQTKLTALLSDMRPTASEKPVERRGVHWGYLVALGVTIASMGVLAAYLGLIPRG